VSRPRLLNLTWPVALMGGLMVGRSWLSEIKPQGQTNFTVGGRCQKRKNGGFVFLSGR
jgi:hypothetical protein